MFYTQHTVWPDAVDGTHNVYAVILSCFLHYVADNTNYHYPHGKLSCAVLFILFITHLMGKYRTVSKQ